MQTALAAGLAWYVARTLLDHPQPFFAPIAAAVSLSANRVLRAQRARQMIVGVTLGIGIGIGVDALSGTGSVAIGVSVLVSLSAALVLGGGFLSQGLMFVNQTAASAILVVALSGGTATGSERLLDALIGGGFTILITVVVFPAAPLPMVQDAVRQVFAALRDALSHLEELWSRGTAADPRLDARRRRARPRPARRATSGPEHRQGDRAPRAAALVAAGPSA